jgi:TetR/AcrR family transcriptional regulator
MLRVDFKRVESDKSPEWSVGLMQRALPRCGSTVGPSTARRIVNDRNSDGAAKSVRRSQGRRKTRAQQQRALATRAAILNAATAEFAERGFQGASIRRIADRTGLQHPLITYHYRTKDILWRAAAEHAFTRIRQDWDAGVPEQATVSPLERLREEYRAVFQYTVAFPEFHRFMRQEALARSPRLRWVAKTVLRPLIDRLLPQIHAAQNEGSLPKVEPILFHYMMVSLTTTLSGFAPEMEVISDLSPGDPRVTEAYWRLVEEIVFGKYPGVPRSGRDQCRGRGGTAKRTSRRNTTRRRSTKRRA